MKLLMATTNAGKAREFAAMLGDAGFDWTDLSGYPDIGDVEETGRTFLEQLTELRLTHAARLLEENRHSIIGAAFSSGYGDLSHFYRLFRHRFGQPPRTWLEKRPGAVLPRSR